MNPKQMGKASYLAQVKKHGEEAYKKILSDRAKLRKHWPKTYKKKENATEPAK